MPTFGSLFSGIGGFDLGLERAGWTCAFQVENDRDCNRVLELHWPAVRRYGDITALDTAVLPRVDLLCGGFPCQDLSVAGRRKGLAGEHSGLFFEFMRVTATLSPRWVLIENVPGLLSSDGTEDMGTVLWTLGNLGFWWAYRVLDAQYFGVAQRRRRPFIVGDARSRSGAVSVLFEPESSVRDSPPSREAGTVAPTVSASGAGTGRTGKMLVVNALSPVRGGPDDNDAQAGHLVVTHTHRAEGADASEDGTGRGVPLVISSAGGTERKHGFGWGQQDFEGGYVVPVGVTVRRLTPRECERLQGFPDDWTAVDTHGKTISDSARYRMLGNAVAVPVAEWIGRQILKWLG